VNGNAKTLPSTEAFYRIDLPQTQSVMNNSNLQQSYNNNNNNNHTYPAYDDYAQPTDYDVDEMDPTAYFEKGRIKQLQVGFV